MRALRVVGITEGGGELSVVLEDSARQERFTVPADEQLRAAARGDLTRLGQIAIELESQLRPREIQARIRAGASVDQVAAAAGVPSQKIERFAYPVLLERSRTAEVAQRAHPMRADGPDNRMLADVVAHTFGLRGQEFHTAEWDSWKGEDGRWIVALSWRAGRSDNRALWAFQPGAHGGTVTAIDEHAHDLVEGLPARPLRTVGPVIDISRPDEQPPPAPEEGHELRAAASDIAARRDVSDWSRVAPEPRRPEPRRQAARPEPSRADEPATEWPAPPRQPESGRQGEVGADGRRDAAVADRSSRPGVAAGGARPDTARSSTTAGATPSGATPAAPGATPSTTGATPAAAGATPSTTGATPAAAGATAPWATGATPAARGAAPAAGTPSATPAGTAATPAVGTTAATPTGNGVAPAFGSNTGPAGAGAASATRGSTSTTPVDGAAPAASATAPADGRPSAAAATNGEGDPTSSHPGATPSATASSAPENAVPNARAPQSGQKDEAAGAAPSDQAATETPAPRRAEPEAAPAQQAPKRGRKGKPVMPSWDEVLLGVRSQR